MKFTSFVCNMLKSVELLSHNIKNTENVNKAEFLFQLNAMKKHGVISLFRKKIFDISDHATCHKLLQTI